MRGNRGHVRVAKLEHGDHASETSPEFDFKLKRYYRHHFRLTRGKEYDAI